MKFIILFFLFFSFVSMACTEEALFLSDQLYGQVKNERNISKQIQLLEEANQYCYAPELEMSIWMLKAESTSLDKDKITYYKKAIATLNDFSDKNESRIYLDKFNCALAKLYKPIDKEVAFYYSEQVVGGCSTEKQSKNFTYGFMGFLALLLLWAIFYLVKKP